ncbi:hypothetical protein KTT66_03415 [Lacticaseibacillus casei]|uniref:hypothetical protein n=1 Tax=Lacticaseibacillus casei TaxID=1582 RepID=UPI001C38DC28|nr:hypothetical protein [Lacticaseibacillus casei]QXG59886.1 hypothetical protein KTT66_03415 [Lacticaseibacillus casei]
MLKSNSKHFAIHWWIARRYYCSNHVTTSIQNYAQIHLLKWMLMHCLNRGDPETRTAAWIH